MINTVYIHDPWKAEHYQVRFEQMLLIDDSAGFPEGFFRDDALATTWRHRKPNKKYIRCAYTLYIYSILYIYIYLLYLYI
jgi:hypothetical protein